MSKPRNDDPNEVEGGGLWENQRIAYLRCLAEMLNCRDFGATADSSQTDTELRTVLGPAIGVLRHRLGLPDLSCYL